MQSITLENLTIGYASKKNRKTVASGINASLDSGHMTCLIGPNGVGKSTLLRHPWKERSTSMEKTSLH